MRSYNLLPAEMKNEQVHTYYKILEKHKGALIFKRIFDILISSLGIVALFPIMLITAIVIKATSEGPIFYLQERVGRYNKDFHIIKFRTMICNADQIGPKVTSDGDNRITTPGKFMRKYRLDEFPQLFNILKGDMSFLGARPEVREYVDYYTDEMMATLLLAPGMIGMASYKFRDESEMLADAENKEDMYIKIILPEKMALNLEYLKNFSVKGEFRTLGGGIACLFH